MFNQTIIRVGVRYGVLCGLACFVLLLVLYFAGTDPFGDLGRISFFPIPLFVFWAIRYYKKFHEGEIGFLKGLRVGLAVSLYTSLCTSMLVFILIYIAGPDLLQLHINETLALLEQTREEQIKLLGEKAYQMGYEAINSMTPGMLAADDFLRRIFAGLIFSLVAAVFFRK
ncbi:DUF4199 domain-containing protein [Pontibacter sp. 172403-2]|uniref:DUF4199 domain-containing protein n=1 Tax=Pontibacter rufus TaxID=2791028 RepID=UPI0018AF7B8C|nr:DUF4199 domain-containing protein [Pontibacter sp. 172403-2]MBF9255319.1 DUF4199 domain-containing protein [Pontibacter sp. 172403-2]